MILNLSHRLDYNALVSMISLWNMGDTIEMLLNFKMLLNFLEE